MIFEFPGIIVIFVILTIAFYLWKSYILRIIPLPIIKNFPKPTGKFKIGTFFCHWIDPDRKNPHSDVSKKQTNRDLMIQIWYPSDKKDKHQTYLKYMAHKPRWPFPLRNNFKKIKTHTVENAKISTKQSTFPVIIFSHGMGATKESYSIFLEELASHGFVIVGADHTHSCGLTILPDGQKITMIKNLSPKLLNAKWVRNMAKENKVNRKDIDFILKPLKSLNENFKSQFYKKLDLENIGIIGHSMGGVATVEACRTNDLLKAGINLDGWHNAVNTTEGFNKPFMFLLGEESRYVGTPKEPLIKTLKNVDGTKRRYFNWIKRVQNEIETFCKNNGTNTYQIIIKKAGHITFTNLILAKAKIIKMLDLNIGHANPNKTIKLMNDYIVTFFNKYLYKKENASIEKLNKLYEKEISLSFNEQKK
jgi:dienelactone hydrolase